MIDSFVFQPASIDGVVLNNHVLGDHSLVFRH